MFSQDFLEEEVQAPADLKEWLGLNHKQQKITNALQTKELDADATSDEENLKKLEQEEAAELVRDGAWVCAVIGDGNGGRGGESPLAGSGREEGGRGGGGWGGGGREGWGGGGGSRVVGDGNGGSIKQTLITPSFSVKSGKKICNGCVIDCRDV